MDKESDPSDRERLVEYIKWREKRAAITFISVVILAVLLYPFLMYTISLLCEEFIEEFKYSDLTFPGNDKTVEMMVSHFQNKANRTDLWNYSSSLGDTQYAFAIPAMVAIVDADNSYDTIYGVACFGLGRIIGVEFSPFHAGNWWKRWWRNNKTEYPKEVQNTPIPKLKKTLHGLSFMPYPDDINTTDGRIRWMIAHYDYLQKGFPSWSAVADDFSKWQDAKAIPYLIAAIDADTSGRLVYDVGYHGLDRLTDAPYDRSHDAQWWKHWWENNKDRYPEEVQSLDIKNIKQQYLRSRS